MAKTEAPKKSETSPDTENELTKKSDIDLTDPS
jgi:hypothetical protein